MKRLALLLILGVVSVFGVAASGGTALANNCTVTPNPPGYNAHPPATVGDDTLYNCDNNGSIRWGDEIFIGGTSDIGYAPGPDEPLNGIHYYTNAFSAGTFDLDVEYPCGGGGYGWFGHYAEYSIKWSGATLYGPWHKTVASGGTLMTC